MRVSYGPHFHDGADYILASDSGYRLHARQIASPGRDHDRARTPAAPSRRAASRWSVSTSRALRGQPARRPARAHGPGVPAARLRRPAERPPPLPERLRAHRLHRARARCCVNDSGFGEPLHAAPRSPDRERPRAAADRRHARLLHALRRQPVPRLRARTASTRRTSSRNSCPTSIARSARRRRRRTAPCSASRAAGSARSCTGSGTRTCSARSPTTRATPRSSTATCPISRPSCAPCRSTARSRSGGPRSSARPRSPTTGSRC